MTKPFSVALLFIGILTSCANNTYTEFQKAAARGQTDVINTMLDQGTNINEPNRHGTTALILAADNGQAEVVRLLIARKADIDAQDNDGNTALIIAASGGHTETIKYLVQAKINPNVINDYGASALTNTVFFGHVEATKALLLNDEMISPEITEKALLIGSGLGNNVLISLLLDYGVNINATGKKNRTPIMVAVAFEQVDTVQLLIDHHADLALKNQAGLSALDIANEEGNKRIVNIIEKATRNQRSSAQQ